MFCKCSFNTWSEQNRKQLFCVVCSLLSQCQWLVEKYFLVSIQVSPSHQRIMSYCNFSCESYLEVLDISVLQNFIQCYCHKPHLLYKRKHQNELPTLRPSINNSSFLSMRPPSVTFGDHSPYHCICLNGPV